MNILFICKYNRFRSQIAELYFNKINKNKSIRATSAGIIKGWYPLDVNEVRIAKKFGIKLNKKPKGVSTKLLRKIDKIIIVANDVPISLFEGIFTSTNKKIGFNSKNRIENWKIPDVGLGDGDEKIERIIKVIITKVDDLMKKLK